MEEGVSLTLRPTLRYVSLNMCKHLRVVESQRLTGGLVVSLHGEHTHFDIDNEGASSLALSEPVNKTEAPTLLETSTAR